MYHNWYEVYLNGRQVQRDLQRQADESRRADIARESRKEERRKARAGRARRGPPAARPGAE
jgi:hypothetical protein